MLHTPAIIIGVALLFLQANATGPSGLTPLHYACRFGHSECVSLLLSAGASVDTLNQRQEYVRFRNSLM